VKLHKNSNSNSHAHESWHLNWHSSTCKVPGTVRLRIGANSEGRHSFTGVRALTILEPQGSEYACQALDAESPSVEFLELELRGLNS